jgi:hypothetical protein
MTHTYNRRALWLPLWAFETDSSNHNSKIGES